jgi:hypothetical protein
MGRRKQAAAAKVIPATPAFDGGGEEQQQQHAGPQDAQAHRKVCAVSFFGSSLPSTNVLFAKKAGSGQDPLAPRDLNPPSRDQTDKKQLTQPKDIMDVITSEELPGSPHLQQQQYQ